VLISAERNGMEKTYYVYIMASQRRVLYIGITSHIQTRVRQHKSHTFGGFTAKYNVTNLVYFERHGSVMKAIRREKELKDWRREKKIAVIESSNPKWRDLSYGWYQPARIALLRKMS
jgi:putative endonuclease